MMQVLDTGECGDVAQHPMLVPGERAPVSAGKRLTEMRILAPQDGRPGEVKDNRQDLRPPEPSDRQALGWAPAPVRRAETAVAEASRQMRSPGEDRLQRDEGWADLRAHPSVKTRCQKASAPSDMTRMLDGQVRRARNIISCLVQAAQQTAGVFMHPRQEAHRRGRITEGATAWLRDDERAKARLRGDQLW